MDRNGHFLARFALASDLFVIVDLQRDTALEFTTERNGCTRRNTRIVTQDVIELQNLHLVKGDFGLWDISAVVMLTVTAAASHATAAHGGRLFLPTVCVGTGL